ncbi:MAG TPA: 4'-phosphopantetheinyl transferase superfamily protein [Burkholderiaceae bacterium]|nr:4'-phosphopantetheinyl transferase superfamily protein [Burkholderiaceae bacterium]
MRCADADPCAAPGDVGIWLVDLLASPAVPLACLDKAERQRLEAFVHDRERRRFAVTRAALRHLLARRLGCAPAAVDLRIGAHGKPRLADESHHLAFNVTHSEDTALIAIGWVGMIGVDLERVRPIDDAVFEGIFDPGELTETAALPPERRRAALLTGWTRKEAVLKALGTGLIDDPSVVRAGLAHVAGVVDISGVSGAGPIYVEPVPTAPGWLASIAADRPMRMGGPWPLPP